MKCITLTQPWAQLVAVGAKKIETRSWSTSYRGPLAIHAAKGPDKTGTVVTTPFFSVLSAAGLNPLELPHGAIVAVCTLLNCVPTRHPLIMSAPDKPWFTGARKGVGQHYYEVPPPLDSNEFAFGDYSPGRFAWLLADVRALPEPIPAKGALGLWNYEGEL